MAKPSPYPKKWTLLFLGSHGRTLQFHHLKAVLLLIGAAFALTAAVALYFYFQYQNHIKRLRTVETTLADIRQETQRLKKENQTLTLQLALKHANAPVAVESPSKTGQQTTDKPAAMKVADEVVQEDDRAEEKRAYPEADNRSDPAEPSPEPMTAVPSSNAAAEGSPQAPAAAAVSKPGEPTHKNRDNPEQEGAEREGTPVAASEPHPPAVVDVANFQLVKESARNRWVIRFTIKRTAAATGKINGRAFIVLKDGSDDHNNWVCVPPATLIKGKPGPEQRGYNFGINNFLNARVSMKQQTPPDNFAEAVVYVYDDKGSLLLEQTFPIVK